MPDENQPEPEPVIFRSLNLETGMLESVEDLRKAGVELALTLQSVLSSEVVQTFTPIELLMRTVSFAVQMEGLFHFMSQAEQYRRMMQIEHVDPAISAMYEGMVGGLSETLPPTHPDVRKKLTRALIERGVISEEDARILGREVDAMLNPNSNPPDTSGPTEPLPESQQLPPEIESFLRSLGGDGRDGDDKPSSQ